MSQIPIVVKMGSNSELYSWKSTCILIQGCDWVADSATVISWQFKIKFWQGSHNYKSMHVFPNLLPLSSACYMPHRSHSPWFDDPNNVWWREECMKLRSMKFLSLSCYLFSAGSNIQGKFMTEDNIMSHKVQNSMSLLSTFVCECRSLEHSDSRSMSIVRSYTKSVKCCWLKTWDCIAG